MKSINIGAVIASSRRKKGITQEDLAAYMGVSKPAVSKWESGQSYPDITLLPVLASYFNMSVDDLIGYAPQLSQEDIAKLYAQLSQAFTEQPFEAIYAQCEEHIRKYYSCWRLLFNIGALLVNHAQLAGTPEKTQAVYTEALDLFTRVEQECSDSALARQSLHMRAVCHLVMNEPSMTIDLLEGIAELPMSTQPLLAKAYRMKGDNSKAIELLQAFLYLNIVEVFGICPDLISLFADDPKRIEEYVNAILHMGDIFEMREVHPVLYFSTQLTAAQLFTAQGEYEKALDMLEAYAKALTAPDLFPLKLKGGRFFGSLDKLFSSLDLGTQPPRNNAAIRQDLLNAVLHNPAFHALRGQERFDRLITKLQFFQEASI